MADHKTLPVFAYAEELPQLADIRAYLNGLGATLDPKGWNTLFLEAINDFRP